MKISKQELFCAVYALNSKAGKRGASHEDIFRFYGAVDVLQALGGDVWSQYCDYADAKVMHQEV